MEYVKINSLWKRREYVKGLPKGTHGPLIEGEYSEPEFGNIKKWSVDEKIDGTNTCISFCMREGQRLRPAALGRTADAQMPCHLFNYLQTLATWENFEKAFKDLSDAKSCDVRLYGEGCSPTIQAKKGESCEVVSFLLFDVWVDGWWLSRENVKDVARKMGMHMVPQLGIMTEEEIVEFVKSKPMSECPLFPQMMEGVVCRSEPLMLFRNGKPLMFKLKCKEFV